MQSNLPRDPEKTCEEFFANVQLQKNFQTSVERALVGCLEEIEGHVPCIEEVRRYGKRRTSGDLETKNITTEILWRDRVVLVVTEKYGSVYQWLSGEITKA